MFHLVMRISTYHWGPIPLSTSAANKSQEKGLYGLASLQLIITVRKFQTRDLQGKKSLYKFQTYYRTSKFQIW